ncbi:hypothetical protein [Photobacterium kasasachensis]|uniref:hypothetical protein n=1 Tax=Photobacterium kasasachensis TaxID=2910240 RepID=UPI003D108755
MSRISKMEKSEILNNIGVSEGYKSTTQDTLYSSVISSAKFGEKADDDYGHGISVIGVIANISAKHFLTRIAMKHQSGKAWSDSACIPPNPEMAPLQTTPFFHAKSDGAATGTRGGFTYQVEDAEGYIKGYVHIAWENPYSSKFVTAIIVSKDDDDSLSKAMKHCANNSDPLLDVKGGRQELKHGLKQIINVSTYAKNGYAAQFLVGVKLSDLVKKVLDEI